MRFVRHLRVHERSIDAHRLCWPWVLARSRAPNLDRLFPLCPSPVCKTVLARVGAWLDAWTEALMNSRVDLRHDAMEPASADLG